MVESNETSRKKMRFSSASASEILTTRKSQSLRDRSGRIAPAASHAGNGLRVHQPPSLTGKIDSKTIRLYPRVTIKDLRLRRVFSPSSISSDWEFKTKGENVNKEQNEESHCDSQNSNIAKEGTKVDVGGLGNAETEDFLQTTPPDSELLINGLTSAVNEAERICEEINEPAVKKIGADVCSKSVLQTCSRSRMFKTPGSFSYKRLLPYLMQAADDGTSSGRCSKPEKSFGQKPPIVNLTCNKETVETAEDPKEEVVELMTAKFQLPETTKPVSQSVDRVFDKLPARSFCGSTSPLKKVIASSPNKKPVCSRRKLFKTPGSVNYRRMLPYLKDIQEDSPCKLSSTPLVNHPDHLKNTTEENTPPLMLVSENEELLEMATSNAARESDTCSSENEEPFPCERVSSISPEQSDPEKEQETQVKHVITDTEKNLETPHDASGSEVPLSPPIVGSTSPSEVATPALNNTFVEENINGAEKTEARHNAEQQEANSSDLTAELLDASVVLETPASISPSRGILRRSIRGCRGTCSCLNCSSFRLNAERAFEFSRNQLQDTELMVLDLVAEISHLRDMLEKHISEDHNQSSKSQAGEASKRAYDAAELAKSRLHQMNDDLQVHCRIPNEQRARVKFAHYIHEKKILKATEPNNLIHRSI